MDIEDYLEQKRALEAKKELLETKERLKDDSEKRKRELEREKKKAFADKTAPGEPRPEPAREHDAGDMYRKIILWNIIVLVIIIALFSFLYFYPSGGKAETNIEKDTGTLTGSAVIETNDKNETKEAVKEEKNETKEVKYPGPEFEFYAEDKELGLFDNSGKIGGENLVTTSSFYDDGVLVLDNKESSVIKCFIDREVVVDKDSDGEEDLRDIDLDFIVDELDNSEEATYKESLPGSFKQGSYSGKGKVTASYEARCYYCINPECEGDNGGVDKNGESVRTAKIRFKADPDASTNSTN